MNLQEHFDFEIDEADLKEFPSGSNIWHIPITVLKRKLSKDFISWSTQNCKTQIVLRGNEIITSTSLELSLTFKNKEGNMSAHRFVGAFTFKDSKYAPNDDLEGIGISEALKNASKNIGRAYGLYINTNDISQYLPNYEKQEAPPKTNTINKAVKEILKSQK